MEYTGDPWRWMRVGLAARGGRSAALWLLLLLLWEAPILLAQPPQSADDEPAFSLASSHIFTTRERPAFHLTFRRIDHLDFRVYRVNDPLAFFARLRDPHQLGSPEPIVPQERAWLERLAAWKRAHRAEIRLFFRRQLSPDYRARRRERLDAHKVVQRRTVQFGRFAQVPLLNASQLVSAWREILPPLREADARRIPLEVTDPGVYVVEAVHAPLRAYTIVVVSDLGVVTKTAPGQMLLFAANRFTGEPAGGCQVTLLADQKPVASGSTRDDGTFGATVEDGDVDAVVAVARCGNQIAVTDPGAWYLREATRSLVGYAYTDKPIYRPGHTVRLKAILRWRVRGALVPFDQERVDVIVADGNDKVVFRQTRPVDEFGAVHASVPLPSGAALGYYAIRINSGDQQAGGTFEVQEYRKPEFEVSVDVANRFVRQGGSATATIRARYYFGQPVAGGRVTYALYRSSYFSPLRWQEGDSDAEGGGESWSGYAGEQIGERAVTLDDAGSAVVTVPVDVDPRGHDYTLRVHARVTDASGREVSSQGVVHATYGTFLLIVRADQYVYRPGSAAQVRVRAVDYTGAPQPGAQVQLTLDRVTYAEGEQVVTPVHAVNLNADADGWAAWPVSMPTTPGSYRFRAQAWDEDRRLSAEAYTWVPGRTDETAEPPDTMLELVADRSTYQPGDVARLMIRGDSPAATVLVTKESQVVSYHRVVRTQANEPFEVPVDEGDLGDTYVNIAFLKDDRLFRAEKRIRVPAVARQLAVDVTASQPIARPRQPATFSVRVVDQNGRPVRAQLSLGLIDEAVYGVKPDETPDPLRFFYRLEYSRVGTSFSREYSFVGYAGTQQLMLARRRRPFTLADFKADRPVRPEVRREFPDAIYWIADLVTDSSGSAIVSVTYPDALTTWRLTARAVTVDTKVGSVVARTTTTKDLIVRIITPRFLTEGDRVSLPTIVHSYLPGSRDITTTVAAAGLTPAGPTEARTFQVASGSEQRSDWEFAADRAGRATVTGTVTTDTDADAVEVTLPVLPYGLRRQASAAGSMAGAGEHSAELVVPEPSNPAARTIQVALAPTLGGSLLSALDFLTSYPYGCTEQTLSSFLPNLLILRALAELKIAPAERLEGLDRQVSSGLRRLYDYQHDDGGWGWWKTDQNHPFMTAYALYGLLEAQAAGYRVDESRTRQAAEALVALYQKYPRAVPDLKAYMVYVLARAAAGGMGPLVAGDGYEQASAIDSLYAARDRMSAYGLALLLQTLDVLKDARGPQVASELMSSVRTEGELAWWPVETDPLLEDSVETSVEATAMAVKALVSRHAGSPVLERAVRWLLLNRSGGAYWGSTKQTAMVLYGLLDYVRARGEGAANFTVDLFVNGAPTGSHTFSAASLQSPDPIVVAAPARAGANTVRIVKRGAGVLYWSASATYYYNGPALERTGSRKLALARRYFSLTPVQRSGRLVYRETPFGGTAAPGDLLLVRLTAAGAADWRYILIEDPLPAGTEPVAQEELYELERAAREWSVSSREFRDDRVVFFQESFARGRYDLTYLLKVVTPGAFRAMPAQVAPMYVPDVNASTDPQNVTVRVSVPAGGGGAR